MFDASPTFGFENGCRKKKNQNMKLLLLFTEVVVLMIMAFRAEKAKHAEVPNEKENIKKNTILGKKISKEKPRVETQERQRDGITEYPHFFKLVALAAYFDAGKALMQFCILHR